MFWASVTVSCSLAPARVRSRLVPACLIVWAHTRNTCVFKFKFDLLSFHSPCQAEICALSHLALACALVQSLSRALLLPLFHTHTLTRVLSLGNSRALSLLRSRSQLALSSRALRLSGPGSRLRSRSRFPRLLVSLSFSLRVFL